MHKELYDYQEEAITAIFAAFDRNSKSRPLIVAPGGSGKTVIFSELSNRIRSKWPKQHILILSDDQEILKQN